MAFVRDAVGSGASNGYQSSVSCPPGAEVGDVLVVCHMVDNDISGTAAMSAVSSGFVERVAFASNYVPRLKLWTKQLVASDLGSSFTFRHNTDTNNERSWALIALSCGDVDPDNPIRNYTTNSRTNNSTTMISTSVSGTSAGDLSVVSGCGLRYNASDVGQQFFTPPAGWVERFDVGQIWMKPTVYTRDNLTGTSSGIANASISSSAAQNGQSVIHAVFRHKTYVPPPPTLGTGSWFQFF